MSHYLGLVFVKNPTLEAVTEAMADHEGDKWDWWRPGGRWDGWLQGEEEMAKRETDRGFNFSKENEQVSLNYCRVSELPVDRIPFFFVSGWYWVPREHYNEWEISPHATTDELTHYGAILPTPHFQERWEKALWDHASDWMVVVDAHN